MNDDKIINLFWERKNEAVEFTEKTYGRLIRHICRSILGNEEDAAECENDTYMALWNSIPPQKPHSLQYYICALARNIACNRCDYNNRKKRSAALVAWDELAEVLSSGTLEDEWSNRQIGEAIDAFLYTLDKKNRVMFVYRYWFGKTEKEIAEICRTTRMGVAHRLSRTRARLKDYLKKEGIYG